MAINVICHGCHARFQVSDKFAGKRGPCPKCKVEITIPEKSEEIIIHAPEEYEGVKDAKGRSVLKPVARTYKNIPLTTIFGGRAASVVILLLAIVLRFAGLEKSSLSVVLGMGACLLAPPIVFAGYFFLHDDEVEALQGRSLWIRVVICSILYAALWGLYGFIVEFFLRTGEPPQLWQLAFFVPPFLIAGATTGFASLDLDVETGFIHYTTYLLITALLRMIIGAPLWITG